MKNCNPKLTTSDPNVRFTRQNEDQEESGTNDSLIERFREILGGIVYLAVSTRPDIPQALNIFARFSENTKKEHLTSTKIYLQSRGIRPRNCISLPILQRPSYQRAYQYSRGYVGSRQTGFY